MQPCVRLKRFVISSQVNARYDMQTMPFYRPNVNALIKQSIAVAYLEIGQGGGHKKRRMRTGSPPAGPRGRAPVGAAASIWFEIWMVVDPGQQNFDFSGKLLFFYRQFHKKIDFSREIFKKF